MSATHGVSVTIENARGLEAIARLVLAGDAGARDFGAPPAKVNATVMLEFETQDQAMGVALAVRSTMMTAPEFGIRGIASGLQAKRMSEAPPVDPQSYDHERTRTMIKAALHALDPGCAVKALTEWAADETTAMEQVALVLGRVNMIFTERSIRREVDAAMAKVKP